MKFNKIQALKAGTALFMAGAMAIAVPGFTGFTKSYAATSTVTTPGWQKDTSPVKFSWYINFSWFPTKWGDDKTSQYITKTTGVDVDYIVPAGNEAEKLNTMIAANSLPDLLTLGWYEPQVKKIEEAGLVLPLNKLAEKYDPYFNQVANKERLAWYTMPDGNVYGYPNASYTPSDFKKYSKNVNSNQTFLVRKDIYDAIGKPDMSTPDGFIKGLQAAKAKFPKVGSQPLIPIGFMEFNTATGNDAVQGYLQNFLGIPREKSGAAYDRGTDPEYLKWLKVIRLANEKNLIAKDVFIDKRSQMEEKIAQGRYFAMMYQAQDMIAQNGQRYLADPNSYYMAVNGPKNSNGAKAQLNGPGISGWTLTMIGKNCKNPERAIKFLSYMMSPDGQKAVKMGSPDMRETVNGKEMMKKELQDLNTKDGTKFSKEYGAEDAHWMLMDNAMQLQWAAPTPMPLKQSQDWTVPYAIFPSAYDSLDPDAGTKDAANLTKINAKFATTLPKLIMAKSDKDFDKLMADFTKFRASNGYDKIQAIATKKMNANKAKLGIK